MKKYLFVALAVLALLIPAGVAFAATFGPGAAPTINQSTVCKTLPDGNRACHREVRVKPNDGWPLVVRVGNWRCQTYVASGTRRTSCERVG